MNWPILNVTNLDFGFSEGFPKMRRLILGASISLLIASGLAAADRWTRYENGRFQYVLEVPPGYSAISEAENGDGGVSSSADGTAELRVWGGYILEGDFSTEIASRIAGDKSDGWTISYDSRHSRSASWSGSKGGRIIYYRAIIGCDGAADYFSLEYPNVDLKSNDPIIARLVKSFRSAC